MSNNKKSNFNYALVMAFATIIYGVPICFQSKIALIFQKQEHCDFVFKRRASFIPIIALKKNQQAL